MTTQGRELDIQSCRIDREPFYAEVRGEVGLFTIAARSKMPVMLKGPTGCGKTRFVQHMAYKLGH
jgi:nitric oxide reductase NorQ protein